jgi:lipopolysaccharide/colanic/teichoic acid biosynthesis glycosyltransferase
VLRSAADTRVEVHVVPRFFEIGMGRRGRDVDDLWGIPLYHVRRPPSHRWTWRAKRAFDIAVASIAFVVLAPLMVLLALAVRLGRYGPTLFRQRRVGEHGREIEILKFRSLREMPLEQLIDLRPTTDLELQDRRLADVDARRTRIGSLMRKLSLDELPQLWNVLRGDMSLVGPRPEEVLFTQIYDRSVPGYRDRHRVPGGLTGWAQVNGLRGNTSIRERARFDNHYIEHWSLGLDFAILARTVGVILRELVRRGTPHAVTAPVTHAATVNDAAGEWDAPDAAAYVKPEPIDLREMGGIVRDGDVVLDLSALVDLLDRTAEYRAPVTGDVATETMR